jgi:hypothetical protein
MNDQCAHCNGPLDYHPDEEGYRIGTESKGIICIVKTPAGDPPLELREKLVGLEIPAHYFISKATDLRGVASSRALPPAAVYAVLQTKFIEVLERRNPDYGGWYRSRGFPKPNECFAFYADEVVEVTPVSPRY